MQILWLDNFFKTLISIRISQVGYPTNKFSARDDEINFELRL
jgi:hypothetical protein